MYTLPGFVLQGPHYHPIKLNIDYTLGVEINPNLGIFEKFATGL